MDIQEYATQLLGALLAIEATLDQDGNDDARVRVALMAARDAINMSLPEEMIP